MTHYPLTTATGSLVADAVIGRSALLSTVYNNPAYRRAFAVGATAATTLLASDASASVSGTGTALGLPVADWINVIFSAIGEVMQAAGPGLYKILGLVGGFFFVWNRVRSLW